MGPTTPPGFTVLVTFDTNERIQTDASAPEITSTQEGRAEFTCMECGKVCKSNAGLTKHRTVHVPTVGHQQSVTFACSDCSQEFSTKIGLSQHRRHTHPLEYNRTKLACTKVSGTHWTEQESASLMRIASDLAPYCSTRKNLHEALLQHFPGRSLVSIKTRLHVLKWKPDATSHSITHVVNDNQLSTTVGHTHENQTWFNEIIQKTISQLESNPEDKLRSADLLSLARGLQAGTLNGKEVLSLLELHATNTFPHTWRMVSRRVCRNPAKVLTNKKHIRRANYAALQALYHRRKKDAATAVFTGSWKNGYQMNRGLPSNANEYWEKVLSSPAHEDKRPCRSVVPTDWSLVEPITGDEVTATLKCMGNSAPGLDKLLPKHLRCFKPDALAAYFNLLLLVEGCPEHLCRSRITLVPKVSNPSNPNELRPIAVSSTIIRCFHKILADRWNLRLRLPRLQFAFLKRDGCLEATSLLHALLRHSATTASSMALAFVDVSKAFDSVSHDTIIRSATAFGAPPPLVHYLTESHEKASALLSNIEVRSRRGVRQGDPLSPLLFIMAMDEVIETSMPQLGYQFRDTLVDAFSYADDLIVMAENSARLTEKLAAVSQALELAGMKINSQKTKVLVIHGDRKRTTTAVNEATVRFNDESIHPLGPLETFTYLGVPFTWKGKAVANHRNQLSQMLTEVTKAPLKPHQRMELTKNYLIPKLTHVLVLGRVHRNTLKKMDNILRQSIRIWLRLPRDTPIGYFHAKIANGGLGVPSFTTTIPFLRKNRVEKLLAAQCPVLRNVVNDPSFRPVLRQLNIPVKVHGVAVENSSEAQSAWHSKLINSVDGRGLQEASNSPLSNGWLANPERVFPRVYIRAIQLRCNLLRTKVRSARGDRGERSTFCRGNCGQLENLSHILQSCWITHDARCARHNRVAKDLARRFRQLGYTIFEELRVPTTTSFMKPDLIAVCDGVATVMDVSIVGDGRAKTAWMEKVHKYGTDSSSTAIKSALLAFGIAVNTLVHAPVIVSYRGICYPDSCRALLRMGLPKHAISDICLMTILGSLKTYDTFMCGTWR